MSFFSTILYILFVDFNKSFSKKKYDFRKGDLFVLSWARVQQVRQVIPPSELLMCGVRIILLLPLVARDNRCMYMAHVCFYVCCSDCVGVCGKVCCVAAIVKNNLFFSLGVLKYVVCLCSGCDGFSVCIVRHGAVGACVWEV